MGVGARRPRLLPDPPDLVPAGVLPPRPRQRLPPLHGRPRPSHGVADRARLLRHGGLRRGRRLRGGRARARPRRELLALASPRRGGGRARRDPHRHPDPAAQELLLLPHLVGDRRGDPPLVPVPLHAGLRRLGGVPEDPAPRRDRPSGALDHRLQPEGPLVLHGVPPPVHHRGLHASRRLQPHRHDDRLPSRRPRPLRGTRGPDDGLPGVRVRDGVLPRRRHRRGLRVVQHLTSTPRASPLSSPSRRSPSSSSEGRRACGVPSSASSS